MANGKNSVNEIVGYPDWTDDDEKWTKKKKQKNNILIGLCK